MSKTGSSMKAMALLLALVYMHLSLDVAWAGSRFYLTIERSYSSEESPRIRIDFLDDKVPLTLRVLKPRDLSSFLEGQLNISRSYEEPLSKINSGHYLFTGRERSAWKLCPDCFRE